jgi:pimeloyl-[acyl-carrier protein] synthase
MADGSAPAPINTFAAASPLIGMFTPELRANPYPLYHQLRTINPLLFVPPGLWLVSCYAHGERILRDRGFATVDLHAINALANQESVETLIRAMQSTMLFQDPPDHTRLRGLVSKTFTPRMINSLRPRIHEIADHLLDALAGRSEIDLIADYAYPLPVIVIAEMLGVPAADRGLFREWSRDLAAALEPIVDLETVERANKAMAAVSEYLSALVNERRRTPRDDLLSAMAAAEEAGDKLSQEELLANAVLLLGAGHETTMNLIGNGVLALLRSPDQLEKLRNDPSLMPNAVEELLRYDSSVQATIRRVVDEIELDGKKLRTGEHVIVMIGAANRDPARYPDPDRLDVTRTDIEHLAFGGGIHFCLGAALARAEGQIAIGALINRFRNLAVREESVQWRETVTLRGLKKLPLSF